MYFRLGPAIYAGKCNEDIIVLDAEKNQYLSLTDKAATSLEFVLENEFILENEHYHCAKRTDIEPQELSEIITHLVSKKIIVFDDTKIDFSLPQAPLSGGLSDYVWDYKASMTRFSRVPTLKILRAFYNLLKIEFIMKRKGIGGIITVLNKTNNSSKPSQSVNSEKLVQEISDSIDIACYLYPKKIFCLGWAATFTLTARSYGIPAHLCIGVQNMPFYAHAWSEVKGKVINDDEKVQKYLTTLCMLPFKE